MKNEEMQKFIDKHTSEIMEHCDSVQVFITWHEGGEELTKSYETGKGNFYTRFGQICEWMEIQREYSKCHGRRKDAERNEE